MSCSHCKPLPTADKVVDTPRGGELLDQLTLRLGQEKGERERLERLLIEVAEALRPVRGLTPHPIVDIWSRSAQAAQKALDAYAAEAAPAQTVSAPEPESEVEFYKRTAQELREAYEIERAKVVDLERQLEIEVARVADRDIKLAALDDSAQKAWGAEAAARSALREMAKLV